MRLRDWLTRLFFQWGASLYARKLSWGPEAALREEFVAFLPVTEGARILDLGCGPGYVAQSLARRGARVVAVDRSRRMVAWAARAAMRCGTNGLRMGVAQAERLPFPDCAFDLALATTVLYLLPDARVALAEMLRVTRSGGWVATLDPAATMSVESTRAYAAARALNPRETRQLVLWARAAQWHRGFTEERIIGLYRSLGLENVMLERRLGNLALFVRGRVPEERRAAE